MSANGERRDTSAGPVSNAGSEKAVCGTRGWLPGGADAPMSACAKRPNRQTELIHIQAL